MNVLYLVATMPEEERDNIQTMRHRTIYKNEDVLVFGSSNSDTYHNLGVYHISKRTTSSYLETRMLPRGNIYKSDINVAFGYVPNLSTTKAPDLIVRGFFILGFNSCNQIIQFIVYIKVVCSFIIFYYII